MLISESMYDYLKSYIKWVEEGAVDEKPYWREDGLCFNRHCRVIKPNTLPLIGEELVLLFEAEGLNLRFPFGKDNFHTRYDNKTQHEDPLRLKWINDHIEEYEKVNNL